MNADEYKRAKALSGITVVDIWCAKFRITRDQDKSMSMGRTAISPEMEFKVKTLLEELKEGAQLLAIELTTVLHKCQVSQHLETLAIEIAFPSGKNVKLLNHGIDRLNFWPIYEADVPLRDAALFLRIPVRSKKGIGSKPKLGWVLWRGDFTENRNLGRFQNYENRLDETLLLEVFKRFS